MAKGVKSKEFKCIWRAMFIMCLGYPQNPTSAQKKMYKDYYRTTVRLLPCKFCREFSVNFLEKHLPLNYKNKDTLFESLYLWKDAVNRKLINSGDTSTANSPPLSVIKRKYEKLYATCKPSIGKCV
jgi:hypothetical protein